MKTAKKISRKQKKRVQRLNKAPVNGVVLELDGQVSVLEYRNRKVVDRQVLDGAMILQVLIKAISSGIDRLETR